MNVQEKIPFFSVIVVSLNAENSIEGTIRSALEQTFDDFEIIVKDGCSRDSTIKHIPEDPRIKVFVEKDTGIYDAMNQATRKACGNYVIYMNCGDSFHDSHVLQRCYDKMKDSKTPSVWYGHAYVESSQEEFHFDEELGDYFWYLNTLCHQSVLFPRCLLGRIPYDTKYRISADRKLLTNLYFKKVPFRLLDFVVSTYEGNGVSDSKKGVAMIVKEQRGIRREEFPTDLRIKLYWRHVFLYLKKHLGM